MSLAKRPLVPLALITVFGLSAAQLPAQNAGAQAPGINYRERPRYPYDAQRLKRRPTLDGMIGANEWDPLYTIDDTTVKGTVYLNWDDDYLYVAAKTDQPGYLVIDIDANADGWLRGADNLELTVAPSGDSTTSAAITARILDAAGNKDAPVWNDKVVDTRSIQAAQRTTGGSWTVELAIPKGIAGLMPRAGATMSVRADLLPLTAAATPTAPYEPHLLLDINLVEAKTIAAPGVTPRLSLEDAKLIPGQTLKATFELVNQTEEPLKVRAITWQGEGAASDIVNLLRDVNVEPVKGLKIGKLHYKTDLPSTAVPGFYQLTALAQLDSGRVVASTASFSVVEPFTLQIATSPELINVLGPTPVKIFVDVNCAAPGYTRADVEIETPAGWEVKGKKRKSFDVAKEDSTARAPFYLTLPSTTQAGEYIVHATVYWKGRTWKTHRTIKVSAAAAAPPTVQPEKKKP